MGNIKYLYMYADNESVKPCNAVKAIQLAASFRFNLTCVEISKHFNVGENLMGKKRNVSMQITTRRVQTGELGQLVCYPSRSRNVTVGKNRDEVVCRAAIINISVTSSLRVLIYICEA